LQDAFKLLLKANVLIQVRNKRYLQVASKLLSKANAPIQVQNERYLQDAFKLLLKANALIQVHADTWWGAVNLTKNIKKTNYCSVPICKIHLHRSCSLFTHQLVMTHALALPSWLRLALLRPFVPFLFIWVNVCPVWADNLVSVGEPNIR